MYYRRLHLQKKLLKMWTHFLLLGALVSLFLFLTNMGVIVWGAIVGNLSTELIFDHPNFWEEDSTWPEHHHTNKFIISYIYGTSIIYYVPGDIYWEAWKRIYAISFNTLYFLTGELFEKTFRDVVNLIWDSDWFNGYSSETLGDVIQNDGVQAVATTLCIIFFIIPFITPYAPSCLLFENKGSIGKFLIFIKFTVIYFVFTSSTFIGTIEVIMWGDIYRIGFWAQFWLRLSILCIYCFFDLREVAYIVEKAIPKEKREIEKAKEKEESVRWSWYIIFVYYIGMYIPTMAGIRLWGLVWSNAYMLGLSVCFLILKIVSTQGSHTSHVLQKLWDYTIGVCWKSKNI